MYMYLHACMQGACRVHVCVMPYFGLAVNIFYSFYSCLLEASYNLTIKFGLVG